MNYLVIGINYEQGCSFSSVIHCDPSTDNVKDLLANNKGMDPSDIDEVLIVGKNFTIKQR